MPKAKVFDDVKAELQVQKKAHRKHVDQKRRLKKKNPVALALLESAIRGPASSAPSGRWG